MPRTTTEIDEKVSVTTKFRYKSLSQFKREMKNLDKLVKRIKQNIAGFGNTGTWQKTFSKLDKFISKLERADAVAASISGRLNSFVGGGVGANKRRPRRRSPYTYSESGFVGPPSTRSGRTAWTNGMYMLAGGLLRPGYPADLSEGVRALTNMRKLRAAIPAVQAGRIATLAWGGTRYATHFGEGYTERANLLNRFGGPGSNRRLLSQYAGASSPWNTGFVRKTAHTANIMRPPAFWGHGYQQRLLNAGPTEFAPQSGPIYDLNQGPGGVWGMSGRGPGLGAFHRMRHAGKRFAFGARRVGLQDPVYGKAYSERLEQKAAMRAWRSNYNVIARVIGRAVARGWKGNAQLINRVIGKPIKNLVMGIGRRVGNGLLNVTGMKGKSGMGVLSSLLGAPFKMLGAGRRMLMTPFRGLTRLRHLFWNIAFLGGMGATAGYAGMKALAPAGKREMWEKQFSLIMGKGNTGMERYRSGRGGAFKRIGYLMTQAQRLPTTVEQTVEAGRLMEVFQLFTKRRFQAAASASAAYNQPLVNVSEALGRMKMGAFGLAMRSLRMMGISPEGLKAEGIKFKGASPAPGTNRMDIIDAVIRIWEKRVGGLIDVMADTWEVKLENVGDAFRNMMGKSMRNTLSGGKSLLDSLIGSFNYIGANAKAPEILGNLARGAGSVASRVLTGIFTKSGRKRLGGNLIELANIERVNRLKATTTGQGLIMPPPPVKKRMDELNQRWRRNPLLAGADMVAGLLKSAFATGTTLLGIELSKIPDYLIVGASNLWAALRKGGEWLGTVFNTFITSMFTNTNNLGIQQRLNTPFLAAGARNQAASQFLQSDDPKVREKLRMLFSVVDPETKARVGMQTPYGLALVSEKLGVEGLYDFKGSYRYKSNARMLNAKEKVVANARKLKILKNALKKDPTGASIGLQGLGPLSGPQEFKIEPIGFGDLVDVSKKNLANKTADEIAALKMFGGVLGKVGGRAAEMSGFGLGYGYMRQARGLIAAGRIKAQEAGKSAKLSTYAKMYDVYRNKGYPMTEADAMARKDAWKAGKSAYDSVRKRTMEEVSFRKMVALNSPEAVRSQIIQRANSKAERYLQAHPNADYGALEARRKKYIADNLDRAERMEKAGTAASISDLAQVNTTNTVTLRTVMHEVVKSVDKLYEALVGTPIEEP